MMPFIVERTDPHAVHPHLTDETWDCDTAADAAIIFDSEASPQNWPMQEIAAELNAEGEVRHVDVETLVEVTARRVG
jgi:hypothetical protein